MRISKQGEQEMTARHGQEDSSKAMNIVWVNISVHHIGCTHTISSRNYFTEKQLAE